MRERFCCITVLDMGGMDEDDQQQAQRIDGDVALAALDLFAGIVALEPTHFGRLDALAVDDGDTRFWFLARFYPDTLTQGGVDLS